jgi:hypothetical protein
MKLPLKNLITILLIGTAFITKEVKSQSKKLIHIGFKGGANSSDLSLSHSNLDSKYSLGYHAGVFTRVDISQLYLQGELLYCKKRSKIESSNFGAQKVNWSNIEVRY